MVDYYKDNPTIICNQNITLPSIDSTIQSFIENHYNEWYIKISGAVKTDDFSGNNLYYDPKSDIFFELTDDYNKLKKHSFLDIMHPFTNIVEIKMTKKTNKKIIIICNEIKISVKQGIYVKELREQFDITDELICHGKIINDNDMIVEDSTIYIVTPLNHIDNYIEKDNINYCSTMLPKSEAIPQSLISLCNTKKLTFLKLLSGAYHVHNLILYHHMDCPVSVIKDIARTEMNPDYLINDNKLLGMLSKDAILKHISIKKKGTSSQSDLLPIVEQAIQLEEATRLSEEWQQKFEKAEKSTSIIDWMDVAVDLQRYVALKFVTEDRIEELINLMRTVIVKNPPHWRKYNRAARGEFQVDQVARDTLLWDSHNCSYTTLLQELENNNHTVIVSGSVS